MMRIAVRRGGAVHCRAELPLALPALSVWGQLRDFHCYARQDYFHERIDIEGGMPRVGAQLCIRHSRVGLVVERYGRILWWREGVGYSFSDLSRDGPHRGFPHIFSYRVRAVGESSCVLQIAVRGKWTLRWIPRFVVRLWLWWVFWHIVIRVRNQLLVYEIARRKRREAERKSFAHSSKAKP